MKKRKFKHWNLNYIFNRLKDIFFQFLNPELPWLTPKSIELIKDLVKKNDVMLELGSGRSTIWFSQYTKKIFSLETNKSWAKLVNEKIKKLSIKNANLILVDCNNEKLQSINYLKTIDSLKNNNFDIILVDGKFRDISTTNCIKILKPGGLLIIDNINRYLPSTSKSPGSRSYAMGPLNQEWGEIASKIKSWRCIWTSNGVTDTAIFFKP